MFQKSYIQFNDLGAKQDFGHLRVNWKVVGKILKDFYGQKLDKPVFITIDNRLKAKAAYHKVIKEVDERARGMEPGFFEIAKNHGFYHFIKLSGKMLDNMNRVGVKDTNREYWKMDEFYGKEIFEKYPLAAFVCHLIAHELQHAFQTDDSGSTRKPRLEFYEQALKKKHTFGKYWRDKKIELDAEEAARQIGPMLLEGYFEEVGEPMKFEFDRSNSLYDSSNLKQARAIHNMFKAIKPVKM